MLILFITEAMIGLYVHDAVIRPYGGDFLVVIFIWCFVRSFLDPPLMPAAIAVLLFAYIVEISQYFHLISKVGLQNSKAAQLIMGTSFSWTDMLMYTLGMIVAVIIERFRIGPVKNKVET